MLQKIRNKQQQYLESRFVIDKFHNPYLSKFTLKLSASKGADNNNKTGHFISPFDPTNSIYISQSLPVYKSQKFRASLIWRQTIKNKMGRGFLGLSTQFKGQNNWVIKTRTMFGSIFLYNLQVSKQLQNGTQAMVFHQGMYDNIMESPVVGGGIRKKNFSATLHKRFYSSYDAMFEYVHPLGNDLLLVAKNQLSLNSELDLASMTLKNSFSLDYHLNNSIRMSAGIAHQAGEKQVDVKFQMEKSSVSMGKFILSLDYRNNASILSVGYKNPTLNLILPVFLVQNPWLTVLAVVGYCAGYYFRKKGKQNKIQQKQEQKKKDEQTKINQIKLIGDKANANYEKQKKSGQRGLLIEEAYVGPSELLDQVQDNRDIGIVISRNNKLKENIFDITTCLRFYVVKGQLKIKKGDKNHLIGFYSKNQDDQILIKYSKNGEQSLKRFKMTDEIVLK